MTTTPQSNKVEIVRNATNIKNMEKKIDHIEEQVTNDIPHQIRDLDKRIDGMAVKLAGVVAIVSILVQVAFKLF